MLYGKHEYDELDIEELKEFVHIKNSSSNFEQYIRTLTTEIMKRLTFIGEEPLPDRYTLDILFAIIKQRK